jgi:hypothetical protein
MSNRVSEYYFNEINGWMNSIEYYDRQIDQEIKWFEDIIALNTIPGLASSVHHFVKKFEEKRKAWQELKVVCAEFRERLYDEESEEYLEDELLDEELVLSHRDHRDRMKRMEREYLDLKYAGDEFIADTLIVHRQK